MAGTVRQNGCCFAARPALPSPSQIHSRDDLGGDFSKAKSFQKQKAAPKGGLSN
jgi:hypothetical protein